MQHTQPLLVPVGQANSARPAMTSMIFRPPKAARIVLVVSAFGLDANQAHRRSC